MALNNVTFAKQNGGLARALPGEDHISALLVFPTALATYPTAIAPAVSMSATGNNWIRTLGDISDLEALGFNKNTGTNDEKYCWYQVSEFFRMNPGSTLWFGFKVYTAGNAYSELQDLCIYADGKVRQAAVCTPDLAFATAECGKLQTIASALEALDMPLSSVLYAAKVTSLATLTFDLRGLVAPKVSVVIGQDGSGYGAALYTAGSRSVPCIGNCLGVISKAAVNESIAWVGKFNIAAGELDVPAFADGTLYKANSAGAIDVLNTKGYIFARKFVGYPGTYYNDSHVCAAIANNDYAYIEANRTMDKAIRGVKAFLMPQLNAPVQVDAATGKLDGGYCKSLEAMAGQAIDQMARDGELSGYKVLINPDQNVLSTGKVQVNITNVPMGVSRNISVKIGFATKV